MGASRETILETIQKYVDLVATGSSADGPFPDDD